MKNFNSLMADQIVLQYQGWEALVLPTFGANVAGLCCDGQPILRTPDTFEQLSQNMHLYGMPLLFPPNRVRGGMFEFEGKTYTLALNEPARNNHIHGSMANAPFEVIQQTGQMVRLRHCNHGERFPFHFEMELCIRLDQDGFWQQVTVRNTGKTAMPLALGFHTTFAAVPHFRVPLANAWKVDDCFIPTGRLLALNELEQGIVQGCSPDIARFSGFYTAAGNTAQIGDYLYRVSEGYDQWVLFNAGGGQGFICVEPQNTPVNALNMPGCPRLESGQSAQFWANITQSK